MKTKHAALPWQTHTDEDRIILDNFDYAVADTRTSHGRFTDIEESHNATFIVRACNSHDDLVAALGACEMALLGYTHQNDITKSALAGARLALDKAKG